MISDKFHIKNWKVNIFYECTCNDIDCIIQSLMEIDCPKKYIEEALNNLESCNLNIGLTYSNLNKQSSIIIINKTSSFGELLNTISHEYYHLLCHLSKSLDIDNEEELASLNGNLNMRSYYFLKDNLYKVGSE